MKRFYLFSVSVWVLDGDEEPERMAAGVVAETEEEGRTLLRALGYQDERIHHVIYTAEIVGETPSSVVHNPAYWI